MKIACTPNSYISSEKRYKEGNNGFPWHTPFWGQNVLYFIVLYLEMCFWRTYPFYHHIITNEWCYYFFRWEALYGDS